MQPDLDIHSLQKSPKLQVIKEGKAFCTSHTDDNVHSNSARRYSDIFYEKQSNKKIQL